MRRLAALATLAFLAWVFLLFVNAKHGWADVVHDPEIDGWVQTAERYWSAVPDCPDGVSIEVQEMFDGDNVWAAARVPGCVIYLDPSVYPMRGFVPAFWRAQMCSVIAHEYGHLLGYTHSSAGLMAPTVPMNVVPGCPLWNPQGKLVSLHRKREKDTVLSGRIHFINHALRTHE